jgi:small conductance mechanosensitive channel
MNPIVLQSGAAQQEGFQFPTSFNEFMSMYGNAIISTATTIVIFVIAFVVIYYITKRVLKRGIQRTMESRGINETVISLSVSVAEALAAIVALSAAATITQFGAVLAAFATLGGALALAIGFAAQDLISNFVAGIFILKDEPFHVGDWIEWNDMEGVVRDISLRTTRVETFDNELITVPNSHLTTNAVKNPVANDQLRMPFLFGIGYDDDIGHAKDLILEEAKRTEGILDEPEPSVILTELGGSYVGLVARVWLKDPARSGYVNVRSDFVQTVKERFDEEGIDMPYPHTQLTGEVGVSELGNAPFTDQQDSQISG